ncbi:hypothetical protein O181_007445 [Austropuccinia psidii MF-1]|uniref:Secreted protein n=1 Tax=Austropuccinia psidii MF-1 TaxID=1389203 RepID=A0A9Q3BMY6_9BASI|nr:hypothetical protein [Austropuccinia psidii MF-1]
MRSTLLSILVLASLQCISAIPETQSIENDVNRQALRNAHLQRRHWTNQEPETPTKPKKTESQNTLPTVPTKPNEPNQCAKDNYLKDPNCTKADKIAAQQDYVNQWKARVEIEQRKLDQLQGRKRCARVTKDGKQQSRYSSGPYLLHNNQRV